MPRMKEAARKAPGNGSHRSVAVVEEEGDEPPHRPLMAKATRKAMPRQGARRRVLLPPPPPKPGRYRPGTVAHREMKKFQKETKLLISKTPFIGLCKQIASEIGCGHLRFTSGATDALQEVCESFLVQYFTSLNLCALHAERVTIMLKDSAFLKQLMKIFEPSPAESITRN